MQGRVLVGPGAAPAPAYVFAARDRMDAEYDMMRSARDARFLYIRNFSPELPYAGHIIYRNQSAIMQEWLRLQAEGALDRRRRRCGCARSRPAEELYDVRRDPHQIENLAAEPGASRHARADARAVTDWMTRIGDQGLINEPEMIQRMWPGGVQPDTAQPYIVPRRTTDAPAQRRDDDGSRRRRKSSSTCRRRARRSATRPRTARNATWRLYTGPILCRRRR